MLAFRMFQTLRTKSQRTEEVVATTFDYTSPKHTWNASIRRFDTKFEVGVCPCTSAIDRQASVKFFSLYNETKFPMKNMITKDRRLLLLENPDTESLLVADKAIGSKKKCIPTLYFSVRRDESESESVPVFRESIVSRMWCNQMIDSPWCCTSICMKPVFTESRNTKNSSTEISASLLVISNGSSPASYEALYKKFKCAYCEKLYIPYYYLRYNRFTV